MRFGLVYVVDLNLVVHVGGGYFTCACAYLVVGFDVALWVVLIAGCVTRLIVGVFIVDGGLWVLLRLCGVGLRVCCVVWVCSLWVVWFDVCARC